MFKIDLIILFLVMGTLFIRQIMILKYQNKIDYSLVILGIGVMGSLLHFITHPQITDIVPLLRESFLPMVVAVFLFIILNIVTQIQQTDKNTQLHSELIEQIVALQKSLIRLDEKIALFYNDEKKAQNDVSEKLRVDIEALKSIEINQTKFLTKFDELAVLYEDVSLSFRNFTTIEMPELDSVVHKHIDIMRVANQDHFNQLQTELRKILQNREEMIEESKTLKTNLISMTDVSNEIVTSINKTISYQLKEFTKPLEVKTNSLKLSSEAVLRDLDKSEKIVETIQKYAEFIHKEMGISALKMRDFEEHKNNMLDIFTISKKLITDIEQVKTDYTKSQIKLEMVVGDFKLSESEQIEAMKKQIDILGEMLTQKQETNAEITRNVSILSQHNKIKEGYVL